MALGTSPANGPPPMDYVACAGTLKNAIIKPVGGPGAKIKGYVRALLCSPQHACIPIKPIHGCALIPSSLTHE